MNAYLRYKISEEQTNNSFGPVVLYGKGVERHIIAEVIIWSGIITRKIFAANFYSKEDRKFKSYWRKDISSNIPFDEIRGGSIEPVPQICCDWVISVINEFLVKNKDAIVLFEDTTLNMNDEIIKDSNLEFFSCTNNLYHFLTSNNSRELTDSIKDGLNLIGLGFNDTVILSRIGDIENIKKLKTDDAFEQSKMIEVLIKNAEAVIFTAYDQQGYVMWEIKDQ